MRDSREMRRNGDASESRDMQGNRDTFGRKDNGALEKELRERLEWYASHVGDEEYDEKAVEYILYLLDGLAPLEEGEIPSVEGAWERFQELAEDSQEILPVEVEPSEMPSDGPESVELEAAQDGKPMEVGEDGRIGKNDKVKENGRIGKNDKTRKTGKLVRFMVRHKFIAAAVLVALIFAIGGGIEAGARRGEGFFYWLKRDDSGTQMITSPENLDGVTGKNENIFYDRDEAPEWAKEWLEIEAEVEMPEGYEWQYFEATEFDNMLYIASYYSNENKETGILLGAWLYLDKVSYNRDRYADYNLIQTYEIKEEQMHIYSKTEDSGKIYYAICFSELHGQYFAEGQDDLDELKEIIERYWECIKK